MVIVFPATGTVDDVRGYYADLRALLERPGEPLWILCDLSALDVTRVSALHRKAAAEAYQPIAALFERRVAGEAFVITNPLVRGVHLAFTWLTGGPARVHRAICATEDEARAWIAEQSGLSVATLPRCAVVRRGAA